jgi:hypothetical protein
MLSREGVGIAAKIVRKKIDKPSSIGRMTKSSIKNHHARHVLFPGHDLDHV